MENMKVLQTKITAQKNILEVAVRNFSEARIQFRHIEKQNNTEIPELMRLRYEKDLYTRYKDLGGREYLSTVVTLRDFLPFLWRLQLKK